MFAKIQEIRFFLYTEPMPLQFRVGWLMRTDKVSMYSRGIG